MSEQPASWMTLEQGTPVQASDGTPIGQVGTVVADRAKDIFSGLTFRSGALSLEQFAPAALVGTITPDSVELICTADEAAELERYEA
jgi:hypothetical protein